ncbi:MAG: hypothetical protein ACYTGX_19575, partial [Planctomycetota bacterium]
LTRLPGEHAATNVDTVLEVEIVSVERGAAWDVFTLNAAFPIFIRATVRLRDAADGRVLHALSLTWGDTLNAHTYYEWGTLGEGAELREELRRGIDGLAARFVEELFLLHRMPSPGAGSPRSSGHPSDDENLE